MFVQLNFNRGLFTVCPSYTAKTFWMHKFESSPKTVIYTVTVDPLATVTAQSQDTVPAFTSEL